MTALELKKYIYENDKVEFILKSIGCGDIKYHANKEYYSCSNCDGDNKTAINIKNNEFLNCVNYTREEYFEDNSDIYTLIMYNKGLTSKNFNFFDALKYTHQLLDIPFSFKFPKKKEKKYDPLAIFKKAKSISNGYTDTSKLDFRPEDEIEMFFPYVHIDFFKEGIIRKTIEKFELGYSFRRKRTIIPMRYWLTGELMGFNMRTSIENHDVLGIPKYYITPGYQKQYNIYGLWQNKEDIVSKKRVVVYESEKSVLKRDSLCDPTGVAVSGHELSDEQVRILIGLNVEVVIAFDKDIDINHIRHTCEKFYGIRNVSYIYDSLDLLGDKDSPADANNNTFNLLLDTRVNYTSEEHDKYIKSLKERF